MANEEQLEILKQGVGVWNKWREEKPQIEIDLSLANLSEMDLTGANFGQINPPEELSEHQHFILTQHNMTCLAGTDFLGTNLSETNFKGARLNSANLYEANLTRANLENASLIAVDLRGADLRKANLDATDLHFSNLFEADLRGATLRGADLTESMVREASLNDTNLVNTYLEGTDFREADLHRADLQRARLEYVDFTQANLREVNFGAATLQGVILREVDLRMSNFSKVRLFGSFFGETDLADVLGLMDVVHEGPSTIGMETIARSRGQIPHVFLQGCGLSDWQIESSNLHNPTLSNEEINGSLYKIYDLRAGQALQISPLFISYSRLDGKFVDRLEKELNAKGIRFWRDIHDAKAGRLEKQINRAIRQNPTVLLILSEHSIKSDWVEHEVRTARALEKEMERDVLCPIALDDSWKNGPWPKRLMEQVTEYNILDFSAWKDDHQFGTTFNKLIDGLELFYK